MRKKIVAGNWKMNTLVKEGVALASSFNTELKKVTLRDDTSVIIAPPFTHLTFISQVIDTKKILLAAQNCSTEANGAYTGEISVEMLKMLGCNAVIIGHSERRAYFNETTDILIKKIEQTLANDLIPIFCCGERLEQREAKDHFDVIKDQISEALFGLNKDDFSKIIIAYEPVWAIGTGVTASNEQAQEMHAFIRKIISDKFGDDIADDLSILYGGSVNPSNASELFSQKDVDGGLVGGASLKPDSFIDIIKAI